MRAVYFTEHGGIDKLTYGEVADPCAGPGEVLVRVRACGVHEEDGAIRDGSVSRRLSLPLILGQGVAGEVAAAGPGADVPPVGTPVVVSPGVSCGRCDRCLSGADHLCPRYERLGETIPGGYAEVVRVPAPNVVALPPGMSYVTAACLPSVFVTAWNMLFDQARVAAGEWVLVHAGASAIGSAAIQLARLVGANVVATAATEAQVETCRALGAQHVINTKTQDFLREARRLTSKRGVDVVVEHLGGDVWERSLLCLAAGGRLVTCGASLGEHPRTDLRHLFFRSLQVLGATGGSRATLYRVVQLAQDERIRPVLDRVLPLQDAREAHRMLAAEDTLGTIVLVPDAQA